MSPDIADTTHGVPRHLKIAGIAFRSIFIIVILVLVAHVSAPQSETVWSAYETTGDLIRLIFGIIVCASILIQIFWIPKDASAYKTWVYLGLALLPLVLLLMIVIW
jgi:hypothetical protein